MHKCQREGEDQVSPGLNLSGDLGFAGNLETRYCATWFQSLP